MDWLVILEKSGERSVGAYVPDLPGCIAAAETREEAVDLIREAIVLHLESLRAQGMPIPAPAASAETVQVAG